MKYFALAIILFFAAAPVYAQTAAPAVQPAQPLLVTLTDAGQIKDAKFVYDGLLDFSSYMDQCMRGRRGYRLMANCLCDDRTDFLHLYQNMDALLKKYPAWVGAVVTFSTPDRDAPANLDFGLWANRLTRFKMNMCKPGG